MNKTAKEYWIEKWGEEPQNDADKLAVAMMTEFAASQAPAKAGEETEGMDKEAEGSD